MSTPFGEYHLVERIAAGGMAEVWRAEIRGLGGFKRDVAIKRILPQHTHDPKFVEMLLDEARISARLSHPNIAQVIQCGIIDGTYYIVMELVDGVPLSRVLATISRAGERLPLDCAVHIAVGLLRALDCAHKVSDDNGQLLEVVHRDVSPHNLLISVHGDAKLIDFGVAQAADRLHKSETGVLKGKIAYMAPEQVGDGGIDARSDQYAAALVIAEMLTGRRVRNGRSEVDVLKAVLEADPATMRQELEAEAVLPPIIINAVVKALARRKEDRFVDCEDFATALLEAVPLDVENARARLAALVPRVRAEPRGASALTDTDAEPATKKLTPAGNRRDSSSPTPSSPSSPLPSSPSPSPSPSPLPSPPPTPPSSPPRTVAVAVGGAAALMLALAVFVALRAAQEPPAASLEVAGTMVVGSTDAGTLLDASASTPQTSEFFGQPAGAAPTAVHPPIAANASATTPDPGHRQNPRRRTGTLDLACLPWCEIQIDGKGGLHSPLRAHVLSVGDHQVEVVNPPTGKRATLVVHIDADSRTQQSVRLK